MNVLSLFDGLGGARIALDRLGVDVDNYFAAEIDKYAIKVAMANYPDIIQLDDVKNVKGVDLPKIDLLIGGFPCPSFSVSGLKKGFDDSRGELFFECVRLLKECHPRWFLFENVKMKDEYLKQIGRNLGTAYGKNVGSKKRMLFGEYVKPILINSALVSAQRRERNYWTNIPNVKQPDDRGILLKDVLEDGVSSKEMTSKGKSYSITAGYSKAVFYDSLKRKRRSMVELPESLYLSDEQVRHVVVEKRNVRKQNETIERPELSKKKVEYKMSSVVLTENDKGFVLRARGGGFAGAGCNIVERREKRYRRLSCVECERLQTLPDNYTNHVSNSQRYKMIGNGFTIEVIRHILSFISNIC